ncbi:substrate-binding domain-containing protein [Rhodovulum sulfidophilum]|nr:substrate-binding domain-containing protein [Rhodovulum sulfidophilum]
MTDLTLANATILPLGEDAPRRIERGWLRIEGGRIAALGDGPAPEGGPVEDLGGRLVTPALVDCHTHLVYGGSRAREFEMRLEGAGYEEIARAGGGILSTVTATRAASEDDLVASALPRLDCLLAEGAGTIEVKSGYGLTVEDELKMLRAARRLGVDVPGALSVTGFDDIELATAVHPPLATIRVPHRGMGEAAGACLMDWIDSGRRPVSRLLPTEFVARESLGPVG